MEEQVELLDLDSNVHDASKKERVASSKVVESHPDHPVETRDPTSSKLHYQKMIWCFFEVVTKMCNQASWHTYFKIVAAIMAFILGPRAGMQIVGALDGSYDPLLVERIILNLVLKLSCLLTIARPDSNVVLLIWLTANSVHIAGHWVIFGLSKSRPDSLEEMRIVYATYTLVVSILVFLTVPARLMKSWLLPMMRRQREL